jgi:uncharacterized protein (TIGR00730 family)
MLKRICVFCGSSTGLPAVYRLAASKFGEALAQRGIGLVFGGGHIGLMGVIADAVLGRGGQAIGVIPQALVNKELAHEKLTRMHIVPTMHERKALMADLADGFVALPGGFGTADEFFEILTWAQLGLHEKPIGLLNVEGFFDPLLAWVDRAVEDGFIAASDRALLVIRDESNCLLDAMATATRPARSIQPLPSPER